MPVNDELSRCSWVKPKFPEVVCKRIGRRVQRSSDNLAAVVDVARIAFISAETTEVDDMPIEPDHGVTRSGNPSSGSFFLLFDCHAAFIHRISKTAESSWERTLAIQDAILPEESVIRARVGAFVWRWSSLSRPSGSDCPDVCDAPDVRDLCRLHHYKAELESAFRLRYSARAPSDSAWRPRRR